MIAGSSIEENLLPISILRQSLQKSISNSLCKINWKIYLPFW